jgi:hypothetical protein
MIGDEFDKVSRWLEWHKDAETRREYIELARQQLALARERLAFQREKYQLNVAKLALEHVPALQQIKRDNSLDTQARIRAARDEIFGPDPENIKSNTASLGIDPRCFPAAGNS